MSDTVATEAILLKHRCRSWLCKDCGLSKGLAVRNRLMDKISLFAMPRLLTLTVDPKRFQSQSLAYHYVKDGKYIPRLMRYLGVRNWVCILECQRSGMPHWHLLIDVSACPSMFYAVRDGESVFSKKYFEGSKKINNFFDLPRARRLWDGWGIGTQLQLSEKKSVSPLHAIRYVTKYLIKLPENFPPWLWDEVNVRFLSSSRSVGSLVSDGSCSELSDSDDLEPVSRPKQHTYLVRVSLCGKSTNVFVKTCFGLSLIAKILLPVSKIKDYFDIDIYKVPFKRYASLTFEVLAFKLPSDFALSVAANNLYLRDLYIEAVRQKRLLLVS